MNAQRLGYTTWSADPGRDPFAATHLDRVFTEPSGPPARLRPALKELQAFVRPKDTIVIPTIDGLAWNLAQLRSILRDFTSLGTDVEFLSEALTFGHGTPAAVEHLSALNALADFELHHTRRRQRVGIEAAKARGVYKGRRHALNNDQVAELHRRIAEGTPKTQLAQEFGVSRETLYQYLRRPNPGQRTATEVDQKTAT